MRWSLQMVLTFLGATIALAVLFAVWALASPIGSSADEDFHLGSIWCADQPSNHCMAVEGSGGSLFLVPTVAGTETCYLEGYLEASRNSAECLLDAQDNERFVETHRVNNVAGYYPPMFYRTMQTFVGADPTTSVIAIRIANSVLAVLILSLLFFSSQRWLMQPLSLALVVGLVPFGLFFIPSVNPSSWAIVGVFSFWAFFLTWLGGDKALSRIGVARLVGLGLSGALVISSRSDAALYAGVTTAVAILIAWPKVRHHARRLWVLAIPMPFLLWGLAFRFNSLAGLVGFIPTTQTDKSGVEAAGAVVGDLIRNVAEIPAFLAGALGANAPDFDQSSAFLYGIGSVDIRMPSILPLITVGMVISVLFLSMRTLSRRRALGIGVLLGTLTLVPVLATSRFAYQYSYAPRTIYPLLLASIAIALMVLPRRSLHLSKVQVTLLAIGFSVANAVALLTTVRRYTNGQSETWLSFFFAPEWWWALGPSPQVVVVIGSLAGVGVAIGLVRIVYNPRLGARVD
jgi:hypothetical protein